MKRLIGGLLAVVVGLVAPPLLLPAILTPWTLLAWWAALCLTAVGGVNVARACFENGWMR